MRLDGISYAFEGKRLLLKALKHKGAPGFLNSLRSKINLSWSWNPAPYIPLVVVPDW